MSAQPEALRLAGALDPLGGDESKAADELRSLHARWTYILKRADDMKTSRYETLCWLLGLECDPESDDEEFDFTKAVDDAIAKAKGAQ